MNEPTEVKSKDYSVLVKALVDNGRAEDLRKLMEGESKYSSHNYELNFENMEISKVWRMALEHIRFVSRFGLNIEKAEVENHFYSAYPEDFKNWLQIGVPGLPLEDFQSYVEENPIENNEL